MVWPREISPYDVHVVVLGWDNPELVQTGERVAEALAVEGLDVLLDDRELRPGEKFADADLIGAPIRVVAGKRSLDDGAVDVKLRASGEEARIASLDLAKWVAAR
jgi:prolyl-tRNA synthetase